MSEGSNDPLTYRPHLDGLRALAVYLVVGFHAGSNRLAGGFIGVDVFFVLSGYLVTNLLLRELDGSGSGGGRIDLVRFYSRRMRRLLPAALAVLAATVVVFREVGDPLHFQAAVDAIRAAALYVSNWYFIDQSTDYFAEDLQSSPVLHFWSLSVEEQFYLGWPLLLLGLHRATRRLGPRQPAALRLAIGGLALASVTAALRLAGSQPDRAYFGTDTRAYQLLAGALLAATPAVAVAVGRRLRRPALRSVLGVALFAVLLALASPWFDIEPVQRGVLATIATVALLVALEAGERGVARAALSLRPLVYLGKVSYGTYLWHWLVVIVLGLRFDLTSTQTAVVTAAVATGLASLSFQLLESPVRASARLDRSRRGVIAVGLAASLLLAVVVAPRLTEGPGGSLAVDSGTQGSAALGVIDMADDRVDPDVDPATVYAAYRDTFDYEACPSSAPTLCTLAEGAGPVAVVVGDSHAGVWAPMLADIARDEDLTLLGGLLSFCPWPRGTRFELAGPHCFADQDDLFDRLLPEADPDIVFLAHRAFDDPNDQMTVADVDAGPVRGEARDDAVEQRARATVEALVADGRTVVIFEPLPVAPPELDPVSCLNTAAQVASCRFLAPRDPTPEDLVMRELDAAHEEVVSIDADRLACPYLPICDPVLDGLVVRRDSNHLTVTFARSLEDVVTDILVAEGVLAD